MAKRSLGWSVEDLPELLSAMCKTTKTINMEILLFTLVVMLMVSQYSENKQANVTDKMDIVLVFLFAVMSEHY